VPQLWAALADRPELLGVLGCGSTEGLGGMSYGLARLATLLDDGEVRSWAQAGVELAGAAAEFPTPPGWNAGLAGCLAAMDAVQTEIGSAAAGSLAAACADRLVGLVERTEGRCAPDGAAAVGFAAGPAGVGWALHRYASRTGDPGYRRAARRALWRVGEQIATEAGRGHGWCCGTAGLLVTRTCLAEQSGRSGQSGQSAPAELRAAVRALAERPVLEDLSLCHGELGVAEALTVLGAADRSRTAQRAVRRRAGLVLDAIHRRGPRCATPGGLATPGLLHGIAGIGYGLLRLGFAEAVPSVLLLEPTPGPPRTTD
jgi:lantibiotic modifying enzyme